MEYIYLYLSIYILQNNDTVAIPRRGRKMTMAWLVMGHWYTVDQVQSVHAWNIDDWLLRGNSSLGAIQLRILEDYISISICGVKRNSVLNIDTVMS